MAPVGMKWEYFQTETLPGFAAFCAISLRCLVRVARAFRVLDHGMNPTGARQ